MTIFTDMDAKIPQLQTSWDSFLLLLPRMLNVKRWNEFMLQIKSNQVKSVGAKRETILWKLASILLVFCAFSSTSISCTCFNRQIEF